MPLSRERMREYQRERRAGNPERTQRENREAARRLRERMATEPGLRERRQAMVRRWQEENRELVAEQARLRYDRLREQPVSVEELRAKNREGQLRYRGKPANAIKTQARWKAAAALKRGRLKRGPCGVCGSEWAEMHHADYTKPYVVEWLCRRHHQMRHRKWERESPPSALHP